MRKVTTLLLALFLACPSFLSAQEEEQATTGTLIVYFPEGTGVLSLDGGEPVEIRSGNAVSCEPGTWLLRLTHPDYDLYQESVEVRPGAQMILLPQMTLSQVQLSAKADALRDQREKMLRTRRALVNAALVNAALGVVSIGAIGGLEWMLASSKDGLAAEYARYRSASAADAPGIWQNILGMTADIQSLRSFETIAIACAGGFTLVGTSLLLLQPSTELIDSQIRWLSGSAGK